MRRILIIKAHLTIRKERNSSSTLETIWRHWTKKVINRIKNKVISELIKEEIGV